MSYPFLSPLTPQAPPGLLDRARAAEAARIKVYPSGIPGDAEIILLPEVTTGNALVKPMRLGMAACAGGIVMGARVPLLPTSRSQGSPDRLASTALGAIVARMQA